MRNKNRGAEMVEFAIVMPAFIMIFYSIIYGAFIMHDINALNEITRSAARYAAVETSGVTLADKGTYITNYISKKTKEGLFVYTVSIGTNVEVKEVDLDIGTDDGQVTTEKGMRVTINAKLQNNLPSMFIRLLPNDPKTNKPYFSEIKSELIMRKES